MQIVIQALVGLNFEKGVGNPGIFGTPIAWGKADEEQGRKILHTYICS
jgi:hypothetical protein